MMDHFRILKGFIQVNILLSNCVCIVDVFLHQKVLFYGGRNAHHALTVIETSSHGLVSITKLSDILLST